MKEIQEKLGPTYSSDQFLAVKLLMNQHNRLLS